MSYHEVNMDYKIGNTYSFTTIAPDVLGNEFNDLKLKAIANFDIVMALGFNAMQRHQQVYNKNQYSVGYESPNSYEYLIFETNNGDTVILGKPWIVENTIENIYGIDIKLNFINISINDLDIITSQLKALGYETSVDIKK